MGALDQECIDVGQAHLSPGLAGGGQVLEQLADVVELLMNRDLWVAAVPREVNGVVV
jgi:hypothetical protein